MPLRPLLLALCPLLLAGCSTTPQSAPAEIPPPPAVLLFKCPTPDNLPDMAPGKELAEFAAGWVQSAACERARSFGLLEAWPK